MLNVRKAMGKQICDTRSTKRAASRPELNPQCLRRFKLVSNIHGAANFSPDNPCKLTYHVVNVTDATGTYGMC